MKDKAIAFAKKAHEGQVRKGTKRPYIVHPMEVVEILETLTSDEELIAAGALHDTMEDCGVTRETLATEFSPRVARIVAGESEDKSKTWFERKTHTIETLRSAPREIQLLALSDKLSNIRDISRDYPIVGEELWQRFRMKDRDIIGWYYRGVMFALYKSLDTTEAFKEYRRRVISIFGELKESKNTIEEITKGKKIQQ